MSTVGPSVGWTVDWSLGVPGPFPRTPQGSPRTTRGPPKDPHGRSKAPLGSPQDPEDPLGFSQDPPGPSRDPLRKLMGALGESLRIAQQRNPMIVQQRNPMIFVLAEVAPKSPEVAPVGPVH